MGDILVLNEGTLPARPPEAEIAGRLRLNIQNLMVEFSDLGHGRIDYFGVRGSEAYLQHAEDVLLLQGFPPERLIRREEQLAFWINLYNALVIHGVIVLGIRESVKEEPGFFRMIAYRVGTHLFTPDDIEHGILRGNRHPPHRLFKPFAAADPRLRLVIEPPDSRIHFALNCASASCPPISCYTAEKIEQQLDLAASGFINGPEVEVLPHENLLRLSPIFKWYRPDFGGHEGVIDILVRYLDPGAAKEFLLKRGMGADVEWKEYDWSLKG